MSAIKNRVQIDAPLTKVYAALTTEAGVRGWWNQRCHIASEVGQESTYHFTKGGGDVHMRFRNTVLSPAGEVAWECVANDNRTWVGTRVSWRLAPEAGGTRVEFSHDGWAEGVADTDGYRMVAGGWEHFMGSLRAYVESGTGQPFE